MVKGETIKLFITRFNFSLLLRVNLAHQALKVGNDDLVRKQDLVATIERIFLRTI